MKKRIAVRILSALMALLLLAALCALAGCRGNADGQEKKLSVVAAVFPVYDWVKNILGDRAESVELTLLLDSGVDLHNYQPTVDDIVKLPTVTSSFTSAANPTAGRRTRSKTPATPTGRS